MASERCACGCHSYPYKGKKPECYCCDAGHAPAPREAGAILTRDAFESLVGDWTLGAPGGIRTAEMVLPIQNRLKQHDAALRAEVERAEACANESAKIMRRARERADAAEAERDRLREALRAVLVNFTPEHLDSVSGTTCGTDAAAALKLEEGKP